LDLEGNDFDPITAVLGLNNHRGLPSHAPDGVYGKDRTKRWSSPTVRDRIRFASQSRALGSTVTRDGTCWLHSDQPSSGVRKRRVSLTANGGYFPGVPLPFLLPWPRLTLLIRRILTTQWDPEDWPTAKAELRRALALRSKLARAPWWN
jgi:hypothetical protein